MTKIQVRRDTSTNWSTNNPTPAIGEPCYETDTGKLKIGNGTTAYNDLPYIGDSGGGGESYVLPPATVDTLGGIKVGNNLSITEDGTLSATGTAPTNMMTTNTAQTVSGRKTFNSGSLWCTDVLSTGGTYIIQDTAGAVVAGYNSKNLQLTGTNITTLKSGQTKEVIDAGNLQNYIVAGSNISVTPDATGKITLSSALSSTIDTLNVNQLSLGNSANTNLTMYAKGSQYPILGGDNTNSSIHLMFPGYAWSDEFPNLELVANSDVSQLNMYLDPEVGNNVINVGRNKAADLKISRKPDDSTAAKLYTNLDTGNLQHNIVAGTNITTSVDDDGKVTINATAGGSEPPSNMVTTDTKQTITGAKTFSSSTFSIQPGDYQVFQATTSNVYVGTTNSDASIYANVSLITRENGNIIVKRGGISGSSSTVLDTGNFATVAPTGNLKYWTGTEAAYTELGTKDPDTLYRTTDTNKVYLGTIQLGGA